MNERDSLGSGELQALSEVITKQILSLDEFKKADIILSFVSCRSEVITEQILETALKLGKQVGVPRVEGNEMFFYGIDSLDELEPGYFGILEPVLKNKTALIPQNSFMLVPGLAFDVKLNRIGYGKGFYDRYFEKYKEQSFIKCGVAFELQLCEKIETDPNDRPLDMLVTERRVIRSY